MTSTWYLKTHSPAELRRVYGHPDIPGLYYWPGCFSEESPIRDVNKYFDSKELEWKTIGFGIYARRVFHSEYNYDPKHKSATQMPPILYLLGQFAAVHVRAMNLIDTIIFNQCSVNEYMASYAQGFDWLTEHKDFGPIIVYATLRSGIEMQFRHPDRPKNVTSARLEPGSMCVLSGEARQIWQHRIPAQKTDYNPSGGERIPRQDCYTIIFRTI